MLTDRPPLHMARLREFAHSDQLGVLELPPGDRFHTPAKAIEAAMKSGRSTALRQPCDEFLSAASDFYRVSKPQFRVLSARPLRIREGGWATELFGDYHPETKLIRVWMRTAVRKQVTSFGTFLSTLCHEFCHHLDYELLGLRDSPHTRGFYERSALLYHHARRTPLKRLFWKPVAGERWRIDWARTNRCG